MTAISLEALGISKEDLTEKLLDRLVDEFTAEPVWDEDGAVTERRSTMAAKITKQVQAHVDATVARLGEDHVLPRVTEIIEGLVLTTTNQWGEKTGKGITFIEYLTQRAEAFIREDVNYEGKPKGTDSYSWSKHSTRIADMIDKHLQHSITTAMTKALVDINSTVAAGLMDAVKHALGQSMAKLKVEVKTK
jgi:hypothetical protein